MASYVFTYEGQQYPNIHSSVEHYSLQRTIDSPYKRDKNRFQNIKTRYLRTMKSQLAKQQGDEAVKNMLAAMDLVSFERLESEIKSALVNNYNKKLNTLAGSTEAYQEARSKLKKSLSQSEPDRDEAVKALNEIIQIFDKNLDAVSLIKRLEEQPENLYYSSLNKIIQVQNLIALINYVCEKRKFNVNSLNSNLTNPSEGLASYIDQWAENRTNDELISAISNSMMGTESQSVDIKVEMQNDLGRWDEVTIKQAKDKSADLTLQGLKFSYRQETKSDKTGISVTHNYTINAENYATVKAYSTESAISFTEYSGKNSFVIPALKQLYSNIADDKVEYELYNTLAFSDLSRKGTVLEDNFKIIRSDLISQFAERYITGFNTKEAQRVLIYNYRAYPILSILSAIADDAIKRADNKTARYTSDDRGRLFSIAFINTKVNNRYIGEESNRKDKHERILNAKSGVDEICSKGKLDFSKMLQNYPQLKHQILTEGIKI